MTRHGKNQMGSSMIPDAGKPRYGVSNDVGLKQMQAYLRGYFSGGVELADVLTELQSRYRPPATFSIDSPHCVASDSRLDGIESELSARQLQAQLQISQGVAKAIESSAFVASLFAVVVLLLEVANIVRLIHEW